MEILHVILLGFVKYFWRDAVSRQTADGKQLLKTRLSSLDVKALGLSPIRGHTYVQYAGSLTGGDFRKIVQVAPLVLYDMVPSGLYDAWLALGRMTSLAFQPAIDDIDVYSVSEQNDSSRHFVLFSLLDHSHQGDIQLSRSNGPLESGLVQQAEIPHYCPPPSAYPSIRSCPSLCHGNF